MADTIHNTVAGLKNTSAPETDLGVEVAAATIWFGSLDFTASPSTINTDVDPKGALLPNDIAPNEEAVKVNFDSDNITYEDAAVMLADVVSDVLASDIPSNTRGCSGIKVAGCVTEDWTLEGDPKAVKLSGNEEGVSWADGNQTTSGVTQLETTPILNSHVTIEIGGVTICNSTTADVLYRWALSVSGLWKGNRPCGSNKVRTFTQKKINASFSIDIEKNTTTTPLTTDKTKKTITITLTNGTKSMVIVFDAKLDTCEGFKILDETIHGFGLKYRVLNKATKAISITHT